MLSFVKIFNEILILTIHVLKSDPSRLQNIICNQAKSIQFDS